MFRALLFVVLAIASSLALAPRVITPAPAQAAELIVCPGPGQKIWRPEGCSLQAFETPTVPPAQPHVSCLWPAERRNIAWLQWCRPQFPDDGLVTADWGFDGTQWVAIWTDHSGKGVVFCSWQILSIVRGEARQCGWTRLPIDDILDQSVAAFDAFIIRNSPERMTQETLDARKQQLIGQTFKAVPDACHADFGNPDSLAWGFRQQDPDQLRADVADSLSVPRRPVLNPCL